MKQQFYSQDFNSNFFIQSGYSYQNSFENLLLTSVMAQTQLTKCLLSNQNVLTKYFTEKEKSSEEVNGLINNDQPRPKQNLSASNEVKIQGIEKQEEQDEDFNQREVRGTKLRKKKNLKYQEDSDDGQKTPLKKFCETKNMIKNFAKSIFNYIKKDIGLRKKIISNLGINEEEFNANLSELKENIHSIAQIRALWTTNKFSQAYRIFSEIYIKKHSLKHIFNSRISNHQIHYKYREKLLRSIRNPEQFTAIKDF